MSLSHRIALYVPSKIKSRKVPALHRKFVKLVLTRLGLMFGGSTVVKGVGTWVGDDGKLVAEKVGICYSFADAATLQARQAEVFALASQVAAEMEQDAVLVEVDGTAHFVKAPAAVAAA